MARYVIRRNRGGTIGYLIRAAMWTVAALVVVFTVFCCGSVVSALWP